MKKTHHPPVRKVRFGFALQLSLYFTLTVIIIVSLMAATIIPRIKAESESALEERMASIRNVFWKTMKDHIEYTEGTVGKYRYNNFSALRHLDKNARLYYTNYFSVFSNLIEYDDNIEMIEVFAHVPVDKIAGEGLRRYNPYSRTSGERVFILYYGRTTRTNNLTDYVNDFHRNYYTYWFRYSYEDVRFNQLYTNYYPELSPPLIETNNVIVPAGKRDTLLGTNVYHYYCYPIYDFTIPAVTNSNGMITNMFVPVDEAIRLYELYKRGYSFFRITNRHLVHSYIHSGVIAREDRDIIEQIQKAYRSDTIIAMDALCFPSNDTINASLLVMASNDFISPESVALAKLIHYVLEKEVRGFDFTFRRDLEKQIELRDELTNRRERRTNTRWATGQMRQVFKHYFWYPLLGNIRIKYHAYESMTKIRDMKSLIVGTAFGIGGRLMFAALFILIVTVLSSVKKLSGAFQEFGAAPKTYRKRVIVRGHDEFGMMADYFNQMTVRVRDAFRMQEELEAAQEIQSALLPRHMPNVAGFEWGAYYGAQTETGGDYYDIFSIDEHHTAVIIADVSGHGVGGAMIMAAVRSALHAYVHQSKNPAQTLAQINQHIFNDTGGIRYVTAWYAIIETAKHTVIYSCAGHNQALIYRAAKDTIKLLPPGGIPLGACDTETFREAAVNKKVTLTPGDFILQYTDGITEAKNPAGEDFDEHRLIEAVRNVRTESMQKIVEAVIAAVKQWTENIPQSDDITLVAFRYKG